jgi:hypothetical protein
MVIAHNRLANADNTAGGAIAVVQGWYDGPPPHRWPLLQNLLVHHNQITGRDGPIVGRKCSTTKPRRGISFTGSALTWNSVLYANACDGGSLAAGPGGYNTLALCADGVVGSCECRRGGDVHP